MSQNFSKELDTAKRDALVSYYIDSNEGINSVDEVSEHLLLDSQIGAEVESNPLVEANTSLQLYINRIVKGLEPSLSATPDEAKHWRSELSRYSVWAGYQQLKMFPEKFIDPTLRLNKTTLFEALETRLSQGRINSDAVQAAVLDYLNEFEAISNLDVISGYQDGVGARGETVYFIGRNKKAPYNYYWRSMQVPKNADEAPHPSDWSEWLKIEGLGAAAENTVQPVFMNDRLYVVWCEVTEEKTPDSKEPKSYTLVERVSVKLAFKRFDNTWSAPLELFVHSTEPEVVQAGAKLATGFSLIVASNVTDPGRHLLHIQLRPHPAGSKSSLTRKSFDSLLNEYIPSAGSGPDAEGFLGIFVDANIRRSYSTSNFHIEYRERSQNCRGGVTLELKKLDGSMNKLIIESSISASTSIGRSWIYEVSIGQNSNLVTLAQSDLDAGNISLELSGDFYGQTDLIHKITEDYNGRLTILAEQTIELFTVSERPESVFSFILPNSGAVYLTDTSGNNLVQLNTLFAADLVHRARTGIDGVMASAHLAVEEHDGSANLVKSGFTGANALYLWELFFHMPFLVAHRLNQEQRYSEATNWLHYLFNPSKPEFPWNVWPLINVQAEDHAAFIDSDLLNQDARAQNHPVLYRKAVYFAYIKNLICQGDTCFRELTRDGLNDAKQWYLQALALLGPEPDEHQAPRWKAQEVAEVFKVDTEARLASRKEHHRHTGLFVLPRNTTLHEFWSQLKTRMHNLRHGLNLNGQPISLALFDAPLDPAQMQAIQRAGGDPGAGGVAGKLVVPPYRFPLMINKAYGAVETLMQFGSALQMALERKDSAQLESLQQHQQYDLLTNFTLGLQQQSIDLSIASQKALDISKGAAITRQTYYQGLVDEYISPLEITALTMRSSSIAASILATAFGPVGAAVRCIPNIYGTSVGGAEPASVPYAAGGVLGEAANAMAQTGYIMETSASYMRRHQENRQQKSQADDDVKQIEQQIAVEKKQQAIQEKQLAQLKAQQGQVKASLDFLSTRFSGESLYQWMVGQLSSLYFQAYDGVTALCLATEAAWQYDLGRFDGPRFVRPGGWVDRYHGLLAGEALKLDLQRLDQAYLLGNERKLEIVHTVSIKALSGEQAGWKDDLLKSGKLSFSLKEQHFAERYPAHYQRRITAVTVTLPALVGAYQDVRATLTQTKSSFSTEAHTKGESAVIEQYIAGNADLPSVWINHRAMQQVALSTGIEDSGLFQLNFGDERYLPFEGNGVVSEWTLTFPNPKSSEQAAMLASLSDVIMRIRYTACDGGEEFAKQVSDVITKNKVQSV